MLKIVDSPIVFNPNQELFKAAREHGWMVVLESKDMGLRHGQRGPTVCLKAGECLA